MKAILLNGSPNSLGNTFRALEIVSSRLRSEGIDTEIIQAGSFGSYCRSCGACHSTGECVFMSDEELETCRKVYAADALIIGSPVYYGAVAGGFKGFLDCLFFQSRGRMRHKVGASVVVLRRSGGMSAFDELNRYFTISEMITVSSYYWNIIHGCEPGEIMKDEEGITVLNELALNIAWILKMKDATRCTVPEPDRFPCKATDFIR